MPLAPKEKARLNQLYLNPPAVALDSKLAATLATAAQGDKADAAFSWGNHAGLYATAAQGAQADTAFSWGNHAGLYLPQRPGFAVAVLAQIVARNVVGGPASAAPAWNVRRLNTVVGSGSAGGVTVSDGDVSLPSGTYWFSGWALAYGVLAHVLRLRITAPSGATLASGSSERSELLHQTKATVEAVATLSGAGPHTLNLQHRVQAPASTRDLGAPANLVDSGEVYAGLTIWRLD